MTFPTKHLRWTEKIKEFPKDKYRFGELLTRIGDFVVTCPLSAKDVKRFRDAAHSWAWNKGWRVAVRATLVSHQMWEVECTLIKKKFERLYE